MQVQEGEVPKEKPGTKQKLQKLSGGPIRQTQNIKHLTKSPIYHTGDPQGSIHAMIMATSYSNSLPSDYLYMRLWGISREPFGYQRKSLPIGASMESHQRYLEVLHDAGGPAY